MGFRGNTKKNKMVILPHPKLQVEKFYWLKTIKYNANKLIFTVHLKNLTCFEKYSQKPENPPTKPMLKVGYSTNDIPRPSNPHKFLKNGVIDSILFVSCSGDKVLFKLGARLKIQDGSQNTSQMVAILKSKMAARLDQNETNRRA